MKQPIHWEYSSQRIDLNISFIEFEEKKVTNKKHAKASFS